MKRQIEIETEDGVAKAVLFDPDQGPATALPGVIFYMDAFGPRPALDGMAQRLANAGYLVLLPDLFYRFGDYAPFPTDAFNDPDQRAALSAMMQATTQEMTQRDSGAFLDRLAAEGALACGTVGYCFGGARALNAAAAYPGRVAAAASFHGGGLGSDARDGPARQAHRIKARLYIGMAGVDRSFPIGQAMELTRALKEAEIDYQMENYVGMAHGWTVPDHGVFDPAGAERHWRRLLSFFSESLGACGAL